MLLTPGLFILYDRVIAPRFSTVQEREPDEMPGDRQIIIAGAGRMGGLIDRVMRAAGLSTTVIDYNARRLDILERFGTRHYYGDASRPDLLHAAGIAEAKMLIVAIDDREQINEIVRHVGKTYPQVHIVARAIDRDHVYDLWYYGCRDIIRETFDSSMRMSRSVFEAMGIEREVAQRMIDAFVERDQEAMLEAAEAYDIGVPLHENPAYVELVRSRRGTWEAEIRERMERIRDGGT